MSYNIKRSLVIDGEANIDEISGFETESFVILWSPEQDGYLILDKKGCYFDPHFIKPKTDSLDELDVMVYDYCEEHIEKAYSCTAYQITLLE